MVGKETKDIMSFRKGQVGEMLALGNFFEEDPTLIYSFRKCEKISSAIYLVTNLLPENDPIRQSLRDLSLKIISVFLDIKKNTPREFLVGHFVSLIVEIRSLLTIAYTGGLFSEMNFSILRRELTTIAQIFEKVALSGGNGSKRYELTPENLAVPMETAPARKKEIRKEEDAHKGHVAKDNEADKDKDRHTGNIKDIKDSRKNIILNLLKSGSKLTVKDFSKIITGCSEKTIQRELLSLVSLNVLKKDGEKRWSRYFLILENQA